MSQTRNVNLSQRARAAIRKTGFGAYTASALALIDRGIKQTSEADLPAFRRLWRFRVAGTLVKLMGVTVHKGDPHRVLSGEPPRGRLIVSNHRTGLDIGVLVSMFDGIFLSRADVKDWKVLGPLSVHAQTIFVDRDSGSSGARAIREIRRRLKEGLTVMVFPEGGTFGGDEVRAFHAGTFAAARGLDVDIIPVGFAYDHGIEWVNQTFAEHLEVLTSRPQTDVCVEIGAPVRATKDTRGMARDLHREVQRLVRSARRRHPG